MVRGGPYRLRVWAPAQSLEMHWGVLRSTGNAETVPATKRGSGDHVG